VSKITQIIVGWASSPSRICNLNAQQLIAILASFVNFLLPPRGFGEGWGGVKNLRFI